MLYNPLFNNVTCWGIEGRLLKHKLVFMKLIWKLWYYNIKLKISHETLTKWKLNLDKFVLLKKHFQDWNQHVNQMCFFYDGNLSEDCVKRSEIQTCVIYIVSISDRFWILYVLKHELQYLIDFLMISHKAFSISLTVLHFIWSSELNIVQLNMKQYPIVLKTNKNDTFACNNLNK